MNFVSSVKILRLIFSFFAALLLVIYATSSFAKDSYKTESTPEDPAAAQPFKLNKEGKPLLYIGLHQQHRPFSYYSKEHKRREGYTVDVVKELCRRMQADCHVYYGNYKNIELKLLRGDLDFALGNFFEGPAAGHKLLYTDYIIRSYPVIVSTDYSLAFASADDLRAYNFGVRANSFEHTLMERERALSHVSYYTIYGTHTELFKALNQGQVDALYIGNLSAYGFTSIDKSTLYVIADKLHSHRRFGNVRIVLPGDHEALQRHLNELIAQMKKDKTLFRLSLDYMPSIENGL